MQFSNLKNTYSMIKSMHPLIVFQLFSLSNKTLF